MRQIFKNYLATFIKNWLQTIGTVLFILMMFAVVIGFLAAPLQIYGTITHMNKVNHKYDQVVSSKKFKFSSEFLYKFVYDSTTDQDQNVYKQSITKDGHETSETKEILKEAGMNSGAGQILSPIYKSAVDEDAQEEMRAIKTGIADQEKYDIYGSYISSGIETFKDGALNKTNTYFNMTAAGDNSDKTITNEYADNIKNILSNILMVNGGTASTSSNNPALPRISEFINQLSSVNGFGFSLSTFIPKDDSDLTSLAETIGQKIVDEMKKEIAVSGAKSQKVYLLSSQTFNCVLVPKTPEPEDYYYGSSMYAKLSDPNYSYDFANYVSRLVLDDQNNTSAWKGMQQNYDDQVEKTMFLTKKDTTSVFPIMSVLLETTNDANGPNQLQIEQGRAAKKIVLNNDYTKDQLMKDVMSNKVTPEIVITSGYAKHNKLKIGSYITLPSGAENNAVHGSFTGNVDDWLTSQIKYKVVGIGEKFDDSVPGNHYTPYMEKISTYTTAYVDDEWFNILKEAKWNNSTSNASEFVSNIRFTNTKGVKANASNAFNANYNDKNATNAVYDGESPFVSYKNTLTMQSANDLKIKVIIFIILGIAVLVLAFIFINFIITKELNETRRQIGIFKSFGYKISELSWIFAVKTFLTIFVGAVLGWVVSIALQVWSAGNYMESVMFKFHTIYAAGGFLAIIFIVIPVVFLLVSYIMTLFYLKEPTLSLLSNGAKVKKNRTHSGPLLTHLAKVNKGFGYRLQQGFIKDSMGKFIVVQILFAIASLTFTLMFGAQDLMYSVADQGFSVLQKNTNHRYSWANQDKINIPYGDDSTEYKFSDFDQYKKRNFKYEGYQGNDKIGDVLDKSEYASDSRYRENYLIDSVSNTFDIEKDKAQEMLMPLDYYLVKYGNVKPGNLADTVDNLTKGNKNHDWLVAAAKEDDKIPPKQNGEPSSLSDQKMAYHDHYLNWILSFRISVMPDTDSQGVDGMNTIINKLKNNPSQFDIDTLEAYIKNFKENDKPSSDNVPSGPIKIDMSKLATAKDPEKIKAQFRDTLFGLGALGQYGVDAGKKNNLFLSDITKIMTLQLAESYGSNVFNKAFASQPKNAEGVYKALQNTYSEKVVRDFSPNNSKYWGLNNNPLVNIAAMTGGSDSSSDDKSGNSSTQDSSGLDISKMSDQTFSLIMAAEMLGINSKNIQDMPVITINQAFFNKDKDTLWENIPVTGVDDSQVGRNSITLFDYKTNKFGTYDKSLTHKGVSDATLRQLANDPKDKKYPDAVYAVVPYGLAKYKKLKIGDYFTVSTDTKQKRSVHLKVIGINKSVAYSLGGGWSIDVDYNQFANKYFDSDLNKAINPTVDGSTPLFNSWISSDPMLEGKINLKDISSSIDSMKFVGKDLSMSIDPDASVFGSIFNGMVPGVSMLVDKMDPTFRMITNPNIAGASKLSSVLPFNILKAGVDNGISEVNNILIVFMVLVAVMLLIILVVVMNIIIEQATPIILTLKSLGYNQKEINWITMGSYITGAIISFVVAYCVSLAIWNIFLAVAAHLWHIYVFMNYTWKAPVITFLVVGAILFIGWLVSDRKVQKIPLTLVTGFN